MSKFPLDIVNFNEDLDYELETAITIANSIQEDFVFHKSDRSIVQKFKLIHYENNDGNEFLSDSLEIKNSLAGFYPYMLFITGNPLHADGWINLFAHTDSENRIAIVTTDNVPDLIIPKDKIKAYFVYYFARTLMKLLFIGKYNHDKPSEKGCVFDFMEYKKDILKSMRANAICDECRREIRKHEKKLSESQFQSIDRLLVKASQLLQDEIKPSSDSKDSKVKIFIGSSTEGLSVARKIKSGLKYDAHVDTWADGLFDEPGRAYIEVLEDVLINYEYGIFVFNPDDKVFSRGKQLSIPRDNIIFEYGMFLGKHTRKKTFFIIPRGVDIKIMTDVLGITCLDYDSTNTNLQSAVSDACDQIRDLIQKRKN